jgi:hypothetical protein
MESWQVRTLGRWALRGAVTPVALLSLQYAIISIATTIAKPDLGQLVQLSGGWLLYSMITVVPGALVGTLIGTGVLISERALRRSAVTGATVLFMSTYVPILAFMIWVQQPFNYWGYTAVVSGIATAIAVAVAFRDLKRRAQG